MAHTGRGAALVLLVGLLAPMCLADEPPITDPAQADCIVATTANPQAYLKYLESCYECQKKTLQTPNATFMNYRPSLNDPFITISVTDLITFQCPDTPTGDRGEKLCINLDEDGTPRDTSMKTCRDCHHQCGGWDVCTDMVWNGTMVSKDILPEWAAANCPPDPSPAPTPSPIPTSPYILVLPPDGSNNGVRCLAYNVSATIIDSSDKNCTECAQYCMSYSECQSMQFEGQVVYKLDIPTFVCPVAPPPTDSNSTAPCVIRGDGTEILDSSSKTCYDCWWQCKHWDACSSMVWYYNVFNRPTVVTGSPAVCGAQFG